MVKNNSNMPGRSIKEKKRSFRGILNALAWPIFKFPALDNDHEHVADRLCNSHKRRAGD
jgi:hypothetical protein